MHVAIVTAGGAGMYCGSCMHDNTWARILHRGGVPVTLIPTYTPLRVDERDATSAPVLLGGLNLYLDYRSSLWRRLPRALTRWLDAPWLIRAATRFGVSNNARELGALTVAMLQGPDGPHRREVLEFVEYLGTHVRPDIVLVSNAILSGPIPELRRRLPQARVLCLLQGDDIFTEDLVEPFRSQVLQQMRHLVQSYHGCIVHSRYYRDFMADYLQVPAGKFHVLPLGIDLEGHDGTPHAPDPAQFTVGYFARICPEKGLHLLVEAVRIARRAQPQLRLRAGGYLGPRDARYFREVTQQARDLGDAFAYIGSPDRAGKVAFLKSLDLLSVPTVYREPKGLYVLEAWANGIPVVQPRHGAFPELIEATGGGVLVPAGDPQALAETLVELARAPERCAALGRAGQAGVRRHYDSAALLRASQALFERVMQAANPPP